MGSRSSTAEQEGDRRRGSTWQVVQLAAIDWTPMGWGIAILGLSAAMQKRARGESNTRPAGSQPDGGLHSGHLTPSQARRDATDGQAPWA